MSALAIIGCTIVGGVLGFMGGACWPQYGGDDFGFGQALSMLFGAGIGGFAGMVVGAVIFT